MTETPPTTPAWQPPGYIAEGEQPDVLPRYEAEVTIWESSSRPVLKVSAKGTARAVARVIEITADAFIEDAER